MAEGRARGFSIATKCATVDELIEKFRDRVDQESILVHTVQSREVGTECAFAILLADRKVALAGTCVVHDVYADANNPFQRPGMRLVIKRLGPDSQKVFDRLVAMRIPPRKATMALPTVAATPLARAPRATPFHLDGDLKSRPRPTGASLQVKAEGSANPMLGAPAAAETRTPGSPHVLPANPLTNVTDASLDNLVEGRLFDASAAPSEATAPPPVIEPRGPADAAKILASLSTAPPPAPAEEIARRAARPTVPEPYQRARTQRGQPDAARPPIPRRLESQRSEPLPLPPPPRGDEPHSSPVLAAIAAAASANAAHSGEAITAELPPIIPPAATLPRPDPAPRVRASRRLGTRLLATMICVPLLGAAAVVLYMRLAHGESPDVAALAPIIRMSSDEPLEQRAHVEAAPGDDAAAPRTYTVLVKTIPMAARVTVGDRFVGTTPTHVEVPANTPVELEIAHRGFKPVTYPLVGKRANQRVLVRLQRLPRGAR